MSHKLTRHSFGLAGRSRICLPCACKVDPKRHLLQNHEQRRQASPWKAPQTKRLQWEQKSRVVTPDVLEARIQMDKCFQAEGGDEIRELTKDDASKHPDMTREICKAAAVDLKDVKLEPLWLFLLYIDGMAHYQLHDRKDSVTSFYKKTYAAGLKAFGITTEEAYDHGRHMLSTPAFAESGLVLLICASRDGHHDATILILGRWLRQERWHQSQGANHGHTYRRGPFQAGEARAALHRLGDVSRQGNHRAHALLGHLSLQRGDDDAAIRHFQEALPGAIDMARNPQDLKRTPFLHMQQHDELSSPWIELASVAWGQGRRDLSFEAFKVGAEMDDPNTFYLRAVLSRNRNITELAKKNRMSFEEQALVTPFTMDWLHDMSKAAAAGHWEAAVEMADYYADTPAFSPSDEDKSKDTSVSWFESVKSIFTQTITNVDPQEHLTYYASFLQKPKQRIRMALQWLDVASNYGYAPALERRARIHVNKYIFPVLNFSLDIVHPNKQTPADHKDLQAYRGTADGVVNPHYSPKVANLCLAYIFDMQNALERANTHGGVSKNRHAALAGRWYHFPEVAGSYEAKVPELVAKAKRMADVVGIDVTDRNGGLVYRHRGERGKGIYEF